MNTGRLLCALLLTALAVSGCGTFFNVRMSSPPSWLEGKDYTIQFSMTNQDKVKSIALYYRLNDRPFAVVEPALKGSIREYVIPAAHLEPGRLEYYVIVTDKDGKEHKEGAMTVAILSRAEGRAQAESDIIRRLQFAPSVEAAVIEDLEFALRLVRPLGDPKITIHVKPASATRYRAAVLAPQAGEYRFRLAARDLEEGRLLYYFSIGETHPDFGRLEVTYPREADVKPLSVNVLGLAELAARMERELTQSITHTPAAEALETEDLPVSLTLTFADGSLLEKLLLDRPQALLLYGRKEAATSFRSAPMFPDEQGVYTAVITRRALAAGVNCYYFTVSALTREVGAIEATYPAPGGAAPYEFNLVSLEEMRARREREFSEKTGHTPAGRALLTAPLSLALVIPNAPIDRRGVLHFRMTSQRTFRDIALLSTAEGLAVSIPREDLSAGDLEYFFTVSLRFPDIGIIMFDVPPRGRAKPFMVAVESLQTTRSGLEDNLRRRILHTPVTEAAYGADAAPALTVQNLAETTEASLYLRRAGARGTVSKKMTRRAGGFQATIGADELRDGYTQYHIEVSEPHPFFKAVVVVIPEGGKEKPYTIAVAQPEKPDKTDKPDKGEKPRDVGVEFDPPEKVPAGSKLELKLKIKEPDPGLKVSLAFRAGGGEKPYTLRPMKQSGINFLIDIDESVLASGAKIEYYFILELPGEAKELTWPTADKLPLSFFVEEKEKDRERGRKK